MKRLLVASAVIGLMGNSFAASATPIKILNMPDRSPEEATLVQNIKNSFDVDQYRMVRAEVIKKDNVMNRVLVYLHFKNLHRFEVASVTVDSNLNFIDIERNYSLSSQDHLTMMTADGQAAKCPDEATQFISIAPNDDDFEQGIAKDVAAAAKAANLKTVELYGSAATGAAWINYMSCPNLKGNFYDGDSNPNEVAIADGAISASQIQDALTGAFKFNVTNIWVACEAYNDPMLSVMEDDVQAKKYAAGINDLNVGPSDQSAKCAMIAAISGKPMTEAFNTCVKENDDGSDQWGWGGKGSDQF